MRGVAPLGVFVLMWGVMCVAMMLPTALPMVLCLSRVSERRNAGGVKRSVIFMIGYTVIWAATGVCAWAAGFAGQTALHGFMMTDNGFFICFAALLIAAGVYQMSPLKYACLRGCQHPASFILHNWRPGAKGAYYMGSLHGVKCVGCCIALMVVMTALGMMNLAWMALFTVLMFVEKNAARGALISRIAGWALIVCGGIVMGVAFLR
jgi:predicted metal-binding membrane protein